MKIKQVSISRSISFKPFKFPPGFQLIVDTAEQIPLFKRFPPGLVIISKSLKMGDYSISGFEDKFIVERKMMSDLYSYCSSQRELTKKKMEAFKEVAEKGGWASLIIEASEDEIYYNTFSSISPEVIRQALVSFRVRYNVHIYCNKSRTHLERYLLDHAIKFYKIKKEI